MLKEVFYHRQMLPFYHRLLDKFMIKQPLNSKNKILVLTYDVDTRPSKHGFNLVRRDYEEFIPKLIDKLKELSIRAHFFVYGKLTKLYPDVVRSIAKKHEIGGHGYFHEKMHLLSYSAQRRIIEVTWDAIKALTGVKIISWRCPYLLLNLHTYKALRECGITVSSNTEILSKPLMIKGVLEIPIEFFDTDLLNPENPTSVFKDKSGEIFYKVLRKVLLTSRKNMIVLGLHTRLQMLIDFNLEELERFITWVREYEDVLHTKLGSLNQVASTLASRLSRG